MTLGKEIYMRNSLIKDFARDYLFKHIKEGDIIIDATLGNGYDTIYLKSLGATVHGFDIQEKALIKSKENLSDLKNIHLHHTSFIHMFDYIEDFKGVVFNLGYLPNGDKSITTTKADTLSTVKMIVSKMKQNSFILITAYPGHEEGLLESNALIEYIKDLDSNHLAYIHQIQNRNLAPFNIVIEKLM